MKCQNSKERDGFPLGGAPSARSCLHLLLQFPRLETSYESLQLQILLVQQNLGNY